MPARVVNSDNDQRLDLTRQNKLLRRRVNAPCDAAKSVFRNHQILPVVHIQNRITLSGAGAIAGRKINQNAARSAEVSRAEIFV